MYLYCNHIFVNDILDIKRITANSDKKGHIAVYFTFTQLQMVIIMGKFFKLNFFLNYYVKESPWLQIRRSGRDNERDNFFIPSSLLILVRSISSRHF